MTRYLPRCAPLVTSLEIYLRILVHWLSGLKPRLPWLVILATQLVGFFHRGYSCRGWGRLGKQGRRLRWAWSEGDEGDPNPPPDHASYLVISDFGEQNEGRAENKDKAEWGEGGMHTFAT